MYRDRARKTIRTTIASLELLLGSLGKDFNNAVECIFSAPGRVIVTGMGKSGLIGRKTAATLASTGTPAFFIHSAEAIHGDLGMVVKGDVVLALSNSGETKEVVDLLSYLRLTYRREDVPLLAIVGRRDSTLSKNADIALLAEVVEEGCPIDCAPMASTTAALVLGDALAAALMEKRGFDREDYARFHPGGSLGRRLTTTVADLMIEGVPAIAPDASMKDLVAMLSETNLGAVFVVDNQEELLGILTDGDMKRILLSEGEGFFDLSVGDCMTRSPFTIRKTELAESALRIMEKDAGRLITVLPVLDNEGKRVVGLIRLHDIVNAKIG